MAGGKTRKKKSHPPGTLLRTTPYLKPHSKPKAPHSLINCGYVINYIVEKAGIKPTDTVLEINAGTGNLTAKLLEVSKAIIAVETDSYLSHDLHCRFKDTPFYHRLKVIQEDFLSCELPDLDICVANLPLDNCAPITFKLLSHRPLLRSAIIMCPREFALRLAAEPKDSRYGPLSASVQLLARVTHLTMVSKNNFSPPLKSDISLVRLEPKDLPSTVDFKEWYGFIGICFLKRTKTLGSVFRLRSVLLVLEKNSNKSLRDVSLGKDVDIAAYISALGNAFGELSVEVDDVDEEMEFESTDMKGSELKDRVLGVLMEAQVEMKRCHQLTQADLLHLLSLFNKAGIYFS